MATYLPELHYFWDTKDFSKENFHRAVEVVAITLAGFSDYYSAKLLAPKKGVQETKREGKLPAKKDIFVKELLKWIYENSQLEDIFQLFLGDEEMVTSLDNYRPKFEHHDDTCCWFLNLTEKEFKQLQKNLKKNNLPEDLFYESSKAICVKNQPKTLVGKFFRSLGFVSQRCYTPKQWEEEQKKKKQ